MIENTQNMDRSIRNSVSDLLEILSERIDGSLNLFVGLSISSIRFFLTGKNDPDF